MEKVTAYLMASKYGAARGDATGSVTPAPGSYYPSALLPPGCSHTSRVTIHSSRLSPSCAALSLPIFGRILQSRISTCSLAVSRPSNLFPLPFPPRPVAAFVFSLLSIMLRAGGAPLCVSHRVCTSLGAKVCGLVILYRGRHHYGMTLQRSCHTR